MSRNFGVGQRDMTRAASVILNQSREKGGLSFSSVSTLLNRFDKFKAFAKENGVARFERVTPELVRDYGIHLKNSDYSASYQQNMLSAVNSVLTRAHEYGGRKWEPITGRNVGLQSRSFVRTEPTAQPTQVEAALTAMSPRAAAVAKLAYELGLRSKEAALLNAHSALREAQTKGSVSISDGTKGGRPRVIPLLNTRQLRALEAAAQVQKDGKSLIPTDQNWNQFKNGELKDNRALLHHHGIKGYHELRSAYAANRYFTLTRHQAPCNGGAITNKQQDRKARECIAQELGHSRIDVITNYIGGR